MNEGPTCRPMLVGLDLGFWAKKESGFPWPDSFLSKQLCFGCEGESRARWLKLIG